MAALDFPASPATNQTYSGPGGVVWVWDGAKWVSGTGTTVYAPVTSPVFLGNPTAPNPPAGDADTSVATTQFVAAAVAPAFNGTGRNLLHNPLFNVAQRGAGPFTAASFTLDRWATGIAGGTMSFTQYPFPDTDRAGIGDEEATSGLSNTFTGTSGAGDLNIVGQTIENVRRLGGKTITVSFTARAASGTPKLGVSVDQLFGTGGSPSARVNGNGQSVTTSTTWARYSLSFTLPSLSGKTLGTNNDHGTQLVFWYSSGATNNTRAGGIGVQSGTITIWGVQLEIGSVATPLEKPDPRYDLANCQRFYQICTTETYIYANNTSAGIGSAMALQVTMRATPTATPTWTTTTNASTPSVNVLSPSSIMAYCSATAVGQTNLLGSVALSADL